MPRAGDTYNIYKNNVRENNTTFISLYTLLSFKTRLFGVEKMHLIALKIPFSLTCMCELCAQMPGKNALSF